MALFKFFKLPKNQQYDYKPRYWDPVKEELEERLKQIEERKTGGVESTKARISGGFRRGFSAGGRRIRTKQALRSNLMLVGIIAALVILSYLVLVVYLPRIVQALDGTSSGF